MPPLSRKHYIVSLRGTHGSGKSYVVKSILDRYSGKVESKDERGKALTYQVKLHNGSSLYVVGNYEHACGGCDSIQPYSRIWPIVERLAKLGHVLFEGALVSSSYGNIGRASEVYGNRMVFAFMDTPVDVCLQRVTDRRKARGDARPLNPKNTVQKHDGVWRLSLPKIRDVYCRRVVVIDYRQALVQVLTLFDERIEP